MILLLLACDPDGRWPDPEEVYPWVVSDEVLEPYETARWEEGTWTPDDPIRAGQYLQKAFSHRRGAPVETLQHFAIQRAVIPALPAGDVVSFVGDIMYMDQDDWSTYASPSVPLFERSSLRLGNLETPTDPSRSIEPRALGLYAFNAPPAMLDSLPLDVLQLNNNHSLDAEDAGLEATVAAVLERGMVPTGVDGHATIERDGVQYAVLTYTWGLNDGRTSDEHELFIVPFGAAAGVSIERVTTEVAAAREANDHVLVMLHWGYEYEYYPDVRFLQLARAIVAAGADVVAGQGPHVVQPAELCYVNHPEVVPGIGTCSVQGAGEPRTAAVFYSLGDFGSDVITVQARVGIVGSVALGPDGAVGMGWQGAATTFGGGVRIEPLETVTDPVYMDEARRLEAHLGRSWKQ